MYTTGEIAAQLCLEKPGLDTLDIAVFWGGSPTIASTQTILVNAAMSDAHYLEQNEYVPWDPEAGHYALVDPRPARARAGAALGRHVPPGLVQARPARRQRQGARRRVQPGADARRPADRRRGPRGDRRTWSPPSRTPRSSATAAQVMNGMPPRENPRVNKSLDSVHASGPLGRAHCVIHGNQNYKQTGLLQAYAAYSLLQQPPRRVGFASGCQAFGHRELLGVLRSFGLVLEPVADRRELNRCGWSTTSTRARRSAPTRRA